MFLLKTYNTDQGKIIAVCDKDILGSVFEEGDTILDISEAFFSGRPATSDDIISAIQKCYSANIAGNRIIAKLSDADIIDIEDAHTVDGQKHILMFKM